jgi:hypothetical protein
LESPASRLEPVKFQGKIKGEKPAKMLDQEQQTVVASMPAPTEVALRP